MLKHKDHFHGSDLEKIEDIYGIKKEDITSFSANVNPLGISPLLRDTLSRHVDAITSYPDRDYTKLRKSICDYTGAQFENIIVGSLLYVVLNSGLTMMGFSTQMMQLIQGIVFLIFVAVFADRESIQVIK